jgi:hypothetical protein
MYRVGQNPIYTVYIRHFWQGNHQMYGHIRCIHIPHFLLSFVTVEKIWSLAWITALIITHNTTLCVMCRVGQNRIYTSYMTVYFVISLPKIPYIQRIYMVLANSSHVCIHIPPLHSSLNLQQHPTKDRGITPQNAKQSQRGWRWGYKCLPNLHDELSESHHVFSTLYTFQTRNEVDNCRKLLALTWACKPH